MTTVTTIPEARQFTVHTAIICEQSGSLGNAIAEVIIKGEAV
ncbi:hypothetical protein VRRI112168_02925 [Vreelandella rituensis]|nr:hypothetical protein [Halomonas rituensis]